MPRYKVAHWLDRTWIGRLPDGAWGWVPYEQAFKFANYFRAKEAHDSLPIARDSYGFARKANFMKIGKIVTIDSEEFTAHHDECLAVADELFTLIERVAILQSLPLATALNELANRLDKSISKLPVKFD